MATKTSLSFIIPFFIYDCVQETQQSFSFILLFLFFCI